MGDFALVNAVVAFVGVFYYGWQVWYWMRRSNTPPSPLADQREDDYEEHA